MLCLGTPSNSSVKKPILDLDDVIKDSVWDDVDFPVLCCADNDRCKKKRLALEVDWNYLSREDKVMKFKINEDLSGIDHFRDVCLFETIFQNRSTEDQQFTFKTSRQTVSSYEISIQEGFSVGGNFNFSLSLDNPVGMKDDDKLAQSSIGGQMTWSSISGEKLTKTDTMSWGVDSQVTVKGESSVMAKLGIREINYVADLEVETTVTVTSSSKLIPVDVRRRRDNRLMEILDLSCKDLCKMNSQLSYDKDRPHSFTYTNSAICKAVYGAEQFISIIPVVHTSGATLQALPYGGLMAGPSAPMMATSVVG